MPILRHIRSYSAACEFLARITISPMDRRAPCRTGPNEILPDEPVQIEFQPVSEPDAFAPAWHRQISCFMWPKIYKTSLVYNRIRS